MVNKCHIILHKYIYSYCSWTNNYSNWIDCYGQFTSCYYSRDNVAVLRRSAGHSYSVFFKQYLDGGTFSTLKRNFSSCDIESKNLRWIATESSRYVDNATVYFINDLMNRQAKAAD